MDNDLACWKCGASLKTVPQPFGRRSECLACHAELHVCRLCRHYDPGKAKQCREKAADEVKEKTRANFCDWFQPRSGLAASPGGGNDTTAMARAALDKLFG
ncbi:MAG: hypothetical protein HZB71_13185 [Betaproteobacteria bacterium]|nr:hypothetical protein [Betaproteobacteria bacterium]